MTQKPGQKIKVKCTKNGNRDNKKSVKKILKFKKCLFNNLKKIDYKSENFVIISIKNF